MIRMENYHLEMKDGGFLRRRYDTKIEMEVFYLVSTRVKRHITPLQRCTEEAIGGEDQILDSISFPC